MVPSTWSRSGVTGTDSLGASYLLSVSLTRGSSRVFLGSLFDVTVVAPANLDFSSSPSLTLGQVS